VCRHRRQNTRFPGAPYLLACAAGLAAFYQTSRLPNEEQIFAFEKVLLNSEVSRDEEGGGAGGKDDGGGGGGGGDHGDPDDCLCGWDDEDEVVEEEEEEEDNDYIKDHDNDNAGVSGGLDDPLPLVSQGDPEESKNSDPSMIVMMLMLMVMLMLTSMITTMGCIQCP
jgi:hypothetical protein